MRTTLLLCLLAACAASASASGCATSNAGSDGDAGIADAGPVPTPDASAPEGEPARVLLGFCSGGGWVRADGVHGPICFGPVDVASVPRRVGQMTWWPGPLSHVAP